MTTDTAQSAGSPEHRSYSVLREANIAQWGEARIAANERSLRRLADALTRVDQAAAGGIGEPFPIALEGNRD